MGPGFAVMIPAPDGVHTVRLSEIANAEKHIRFCSLSYRFPLGTSSFAASDKLHFAKLSLPEGRLAKTFPTFLLVILSAAYADSSFGTSDKIHFAKLSLPEGRLAKTFPTFLLVILSAAYADSSFGTSDKIHYTCRAGKCQHGY